MASDYRRFSVNTSLRDANIFHDDSSSADDSLQNIKQEPLDECEDSLQSYSDNAISTSISLNKSLSFTSMIKEEFNNLSTDSPIKQERIDFERKWISENSDNTNEAECPPPPSISTNNIDKEVKTEPMCPLAPNISVKRNLLKRKSEPYVRSVSESESENGVSPLKKPHYDKKSTNSEKRQPETDPETLKRRQKQIDYGKNTVGYERYITEIPKFKRGPNDPQTPDKYRKYSRRGWDGLIKQWRLRLHRFDPPEEDDHNIKKEDEIDIKEEEENEDDW